MSNAVIELMKRIAYRRAADRLKIEDVRSRTNHLIKKHKNYENYTTKIYFTHIEPFKKIKRF